MRNRRVLLYGLGMLVLAGCAYAITPTGQRVEAIDGGGFKAIGLQSFEGIEEPDVIYYPGTRQFKEDLFPNITDEGNHTVRMFLRYHADWWDGDRDRDDTTRQRAEVKGLGPHQRIGQTFEYDTTFRTNPSFRGSGRFCHIFQLKATEGDKGAPLVTLSILDGDHDGALQYWPGSARGAIVARRFQWKPGQWQSVRIRIKTSFEKDGEVTASINNDPFSGAKGVAVYRPDAQDYRPKWGLYRGTSPGMTLGEDWVEHRDVLAKKL